MIAYNNNYNMPARFFQVFGLLPKHQNFPLKKEINLRFLRACDIIIRKKGILMGIGVKGEYTGFSLNGIHSSELGITRVSDNNRYEENMSADFDLLETSVVGAHQNYFFAKDFKAKTWKLSLGFDKATYAQVRKFKQLMGVTNELELVFDEKPWETWYVVVVDTPTLEFMPVSPSITRAPAYIWTSNQTSPAIVDETVLNGECELHLKANFPYAVVRQKFLKHTYYDASVINAINDKGAQGYLLDKTKFENAPRAYYFDTQYTNMFLTESGFTFFSNTYWTKPKMEYGIDVIGEAEEKVRVYNCGDIPAPFKFITPNTIEAKGLSIGDKEFTFEGDGDTSIPYIEYDSRTKLLRGVDSTMHYVRGKIYNKGIQSGDFFDIPVCEPFQPIELITSFQLTNEDKIEYNYYYL